MPIRLHWWAKWAFRFKTMVRYRLLFLTSAPIFLTLCALVAITLYWSVHYTWQGALIDVDERLDVADNSIHLIQNQQAYNVRAFAESYNFQMKLASGVSQKELIHWVSENKARYELDFLRWRSVESMAKKLEYLDLTNKSSFFSVLDSKELNYLDRDLAKKAEVPMLNDNDVETRGLVSRTVVSIRDEKGHVIGFLDGGILLNNSTQLVDQISNLIYPQRDGFNRHVGTVTVFLDDLRVSTNVPLSSENSEGRAIGTRVSHEVHSKVLNEGKEWLIVPMFMMHGTSPLISQLPCQTGRELADKR